jgi:L-cysteine:1D-myo-inositol 2-amino-2-deoxy-alpha-D-glucopyranoside ligase
MKLYNTLTKKVEPFEPLRDTVTMYVCGITPYDTTHLGHAFTYTTADILIRYLEYRGRPVRYVQNVTDIDDDVLRKANEVGEDWRSLGNRWTAHFIEDMQELNVRPPDEFPRATDVIAEIIQITEKLLEAGVAYQAAGNVYFQIEAWPEYGKLSGLPRQEMLPVANERGNKPDDPHKKDPLDFVLWQAQAPGEPAWDSPWGPGRPGWHIECTSMATCLLDKTIDIHSGGMDLVFPHHESEIAQAEPISGGEPFVRVWLHVAMVHHEGEKMSKSLGNLIMIRDLMQTWPADALRLYMAGRHYRSEWSYSEDDLRQSAGDALLLADAARAVNGSGSGRVFDSRPRLVEFIEAMDEDLDAPQAVQILLGLATEIIDAARAGEDISAAQEILRASAGVFGLRLDSPHPETRVINGWAEHLRRFL